MLTDAPFNDTTRQVIGAAIDVHRTLGPGLLESTYMVCLQHELASRNVRFEAEVILPIVYRGLTLPHAYRIDLLVEDRVVVEVKAVDRLAPIHEAQVITYLALTGKPAGLLINFNVPKLTDGVKRLLRPARARPYKE